MIHIHIHMHMLHSSCSKSSAPHLAFASARLMALRRLVAVLPTSPQYPPSNVLPLLKYFVLLAVALLCWNDSSVRSRPMEEIEQKMINIKQTIRKFNSKIRKSSKRWIIPTKNKQARQKMKNSSNKWQNKPTKNDKNQANLLLCIIELLEPAGAPVCLVSTSFACNLLSLGWRWHQSRVRKGIAQYRCQK